MCAMTLGLFLVALSTGCGNKPHQASVATHQPSAQSESTAAESLAALAETTVAPPERTYKTSYDAKAVYGERDLPGRGSYLKLEFTDLSADQLNRVIHRLRTEDCTCGCTGDLIDQCLVNDPSCGTAVTLAKQIIREEKMKS